MFIFFLLTPIIAHADQTTPTSTPSSLEIQRATVGIQGRVLSNNNYDVLIPIDTYYRVSFNTTGGTIINDQFIKKGSYAKEPTSPTRANYEFNYWTLNTNTPTPENEHGQSEKFNFSTTPITSNITLVAVWTPSSPSPSSPSDENKPNNDKEDTNSSEDNNEEDKKDTSEDSENNGEDKEDKENSSDNTDNNTEDNGEDSKSSENNKDNSENNENNNGLNDTTEESTETSESTEATENIEESTESNDGLINTHTNPSSNHSKTSTSSIETDPDIATNTETTDLLSEIKATVLGVFKTISKSITIVAKISLIGILIWFIWFVILLNNTLVKIQAPSEDNNDQNQPDQPDQSQGKSQSWKTVYLTPIKKTIEQTDGDKRTVWSLSLPQNLLDDNEELKVKIPWSVYHRVEDTNQANQTELHITITSDQPDPTQPTMIYIITNETKEIKIK